MECGCNVTRDRNVEYRSAVSTHVLVHVELFWFPLFVICSVGQNIYIYSIIVLHLVFGAVAHMLIRSHKSPVFWSPAAQMADSDFIVRVPGFQSGTLLRIRVATPRAQNVQYCC